MHVFPKPISQLPCLLLKSMYSCQYVQIFTYTLCETKKKHWERNASVNTHRGKFRSQVKLEDEQSVRCPAEQVVVSYITVLRIKREQPLRCSSVL